MTLSLKTLNKKRARKEAKRRAHRKEIKRKENLGLIPKMNEQQRFHMALFQKGVREGKIVKNEKGQWVQAPVNPTAIPVSSNSNAKA